MKSIASILFFISTCSFAQTDEVLSLINEARTNPQQFLNVRLLPYIKAHDMATNSYAQSLIADLKKANKVAALKSSDLLTKLARGHALDMGRHGKVGHESSNGASFEKRLRKKIKTGMIAECCDYGNADALDIVMSLLIDDGIASLGHRKNILYPQLKFVGIAIEAHKTYRVNCVMDFSSVE